MLIPLFPPILSFFFTFQFSFASSNFIFHLSLLSQVSSFTFASLILFCPFLHLFFFFSFNFFLFQFLVSLSFYNFFSTSFTVCLPSHFLFCFFHSPPMLLREICFLFKLDILSFFFVFSDVFVLHSSLRLIIFIQIFFSCLSFYPFVFVLLF